jgi:hypothetical protein
MVEVVRGKTHEQSPTVFCGSWGRGHSGANCPRSIRRYQTRHRRFQQWVREGKLERILRTLAEKLQARGKLQLEEAFIDASFTGAKKRASQSAHQRRHGNENHRSRR